MPRNSPGVMVSHRMSEDQNKCVTLVADVKKMTRTRLMLQSFLTANASEIMECVGPDIYAQWLSAASRNQTCDNCAGGCPNEKNFCFKWKAKDDQP